MCHVWWICIWTLIIRVDSQCSGTSSILSVGYSATHITSPNYDKGYSTNLKCSWRHSSSLAGSFLFVQINASVDCSGDDLTIYDGTGSTGSILHACTTTTPHYFVASTGSMYISFTTDSASSASEKGFSYNVISAKDLSGTACTSTQTLKASTTVQYISSPNFPAEYPPDSACKWIIERFGTSDPMEMTFTFIDVESETTCTFDFIRITDVTTGTTILTTCGNNEWFPTKKYTTSGNITIEFRSDATEQKRGFLLTYKIQSSTTASTDSCFLDNCVVLPVLLAIGGIVLIAGVAAILLCGVGKFFATKNAVSDQNSVPKKPSLKLLIFPRFRNKPTSSPDIFVTLEDVSIISSPPIDTHGIQNAPPRFPKKIARRLSKHSSSKLPQNNQITVSKASKIPKPVKKTYANVFKSTNV